MDDLTCEWAKELSPSDHVMDRLDMDRRSRTTLMTIDILDAVPDHDRLRQDLERATRVAVPLRRRVVAPIVPVGAPRWVVDPDFDLDYHLRRVALPAPGTLRQLLDLAARRADLSRELRHLLRQLDGIEALAMESLGRLVASRSAEGS